jgi:hypothetical protein
MTASQQIDKQIQEAGGWKAELMTKFRKLIHEADPEIEEQWKWDVGVYAHGGMICALASFKDHVKLNFFNGAKLEDPEKLFNAGLESKKSRAIDFKEGERIDEKAIKSLIISAIS